MSEFKCCNVWAGLNGEYRIPEHLESAADLTMQGFRLRHFEEWLAEQEKQASMDIDWKAIAGEKSEELRNLYADKARLERQVCELKSDEYANEVKYKRLSLENDLLRAENAIMRHDAEQRED